MLLSFPSLYLQPDEKQKGWDPLQDSPSTSRAKLQWAWFSCYSWLCVSIGFGLIHDLKS